MFDTEQLNNIRLRPPKPKRLLVITICWCVKSSGVVSVNIKLYQSEYLSVFTTEVRSFLCCFSGHHNTSEHLVEANGNRNKEIVESSLRLHVKIFH